MFWTFQTFRIVSTDLPCKSIIAWKDARRNRGEKGCGWFCFPDAFRESC